MSNSCKTGSNVQAISFDINLNQRKRHDEICSIKSFDSKITHKPRPVDDSTGCRNHPIENKMLPPCSENGNRRILYNSKTSSLKSSPKKIAKYDFVVGQSHPKINEVVTLKRAIVRQKCVLAAKFWILIKKCGIKTA